MSTKWQGDRNQLLLVKCTIFWVDFQPYLNFHFPHKENLQIDQEIQALYSGSSNSGGKPEGHISHIFKKCPLLWPVSFYRSSWGKAWKLLKFQVIQTTKTRRKNIPQRKFAPFLIWKLTNFIENWIGWATYRAFYEQKLVYRFMILSWCSFLSFQYCACILLQYCFNIAVPNS